MVRGVRPRPCGRLYTGIPSPRRGGRVAEGTRLLSEYGDQTPSRVRIPPSPFCRAVVGPAYAVNAALADLLDRLRPATPPRPGRRGREGHTRRRSRAGADRDA